MPRLETVRQIFFGFFSKARFDLFETGQRRSGFSTDLIVVMPPPHSGEIDSVDS